MLFLLFLVAFIFVVAQGFLRVVAFFWGWLAAGTPLGAAQPAAPVSEEAPDAVPLGPAGRGPARALARWRASREEVATVVDAMRLGWYHAVIIFFLGSMTGLLIEETWMLIAFSSTESRVGLVWGPFSPLYGSGAVILTWVSFHLRARRARAWQVFLVSALTGGVLEQLTGWSMSTLFDAESWTYLALPDHITQWVAWRFLVMWGLLGLWWSRVVTPRLLHQIGMPTTRRQAVFAALVAVYLVADVGMTMACFNRKAARDAGVPPANAFERWVDTNYSDEFIASRFQNLKIGDQRDLVDADGNIVLDENGNALSRAGDDV